MSKKNQSKTACKECSGTGFHGGSVLSGTACSRCVGTGIEMMAVKIKLDVMTWTEKDRAFLRSCNIDPDGTRD